jgi:chemotaxis protein CheX
MAGRTQSAAKTTPTGAARKKPTAAADGRRPAAKAQAADAANGEGSSPIMPDTAQEAAVLRLAQTLDLNAAGPLAAELLALRGRDLAVDASAVERMGAQCLQVLLSARATWTADGAAFSLVTPSNEFATAMALLGAPIDQTFNPVELSA